MKNQELKAAIICLLGAVLYGPMGVSTRALFDLGFSSNQIALVRMLVSCIPLLIYFLIFNRNGLLIKKKDVPIFLIIAIGYLLSGVTFFVAQSEMSLGVATTLQMTMAFFIILFSVLLMLEQLTKNKIIAMVVALLGCLLATNVLSPDVNVNVDGAANAIASAILVSIFYVGSKILFNRGYSVLTVMFYATLFGSIIIAPVSVGGMYDCIAADPLKCVEHFFLLGILFTLTPIMMQMYSVKILGAGTMGVLSIFEVVSAAVAGTIFFSEMLNGMEIAGIILILSSVVILNYKNIGEEIGYAIKMRK